MIKTLAHVGNDSHRMIEILKEFSEIDLEIKSDEGSVLKDISGFSSAFALIEFSKITSEEIEYIKKIKEVSKDSFVVVIGDIIDEDLKNRIIEAGVEDYITKLITDNLLKIRIRNYINLIKSRLHETIDINAKNIFTKEVYSRSIVFRTQDREGLAQMGDYLTNEYPYKLDCVDEFIDIIYGFCQFLIYSKNRVRVIIEESDEYAYITIEGIHKIPKSVIVHILNNHNIDAIYKIDDSKITFKVKKISRVCEPTTLKESAATRNLSDVEKQILRKHEVRKVSAADYVENTPIDVMASLENLEDIEDKIDLTLIDYEKDGNINHLHEMSEYFETYYLVLQNLVEFDHLSFAVEKLSKFLLDITEKELDEGNRKKLILMLTTILGDLTSWRKTIFIEQNTEDIHYMDSSLLNAFLQIEMIFDTPAEDDDDALELF